MQIRDATISDIPRLPDIWLTAFCDDLDYDIVYPWRTSAPENFGLLMTAEITQLFLRGTGRFLVIETETEQRQIVAWACWTRNGSSAAAVKIRAQNDSVLKALERTLCGLQELLYSPFTRLFSLPPILPDEGHLATRFEMLYSRFREEFWVGENQEHWFMQKLCVDPAWRRQGIATILLKWGQDRAREENVVIYLIPTRTGMALYMKAGFVHAATFMIAEPEDKAMVLLWRPEGAL